MNPVRQTSQNNNSRLLRRRRVVPYNFFETNIPHIPDRTSGISVLEHALIWYGRRVVEIVKLCNVRLHMPMGNAIQSYLSLCLWICYATTTFHSESTPHNDHNPIEFEMQIFDWLIWWY